MEKHKAIEEIPYVHPSSGGSEVVLGSPSGEKSVVSVSVEVISGVDVGGGDGVGEGREGGRQKSGELHCRDR